MKLRRTRIALVIAACATLSSTAWAGNGQNLLQFVPQDTYLIFNLDVAQLWSTPLFQTIWTMATANPEVAGPLAQVQSATGFNPATDIQSLTFALTPSAEEHFVMLVEGNFNAEQLGAFISTQAGAELTTAQYQSQTVYFDPAEVEGERTQFSFVNDHMAVIGTTAEFNAVLDILAGAGSNVMGNAELSTLLSNADMSGMLWFAGLVTPQMQTEMVGSPMAGLKTMRGNASLAGGLTMNTVLDANSDAEAASMVEFLNASLQQARSTPEVAQMGLATLFDSITVSAAGSQIAVDVVIPEQTINQVIGIITALVAAQQAAAQDPMGMEPTAAPTEPVQPAGTTEEEPQQLISP